MFSETHTEHPLITAADCSHTAAAQWPPALTDNLGAELPDEPHIM